MRVKLNGLNLATDAGARAALARIRWSAGVFCESSDARQALARETMISRCVSDMTNKGVSQLNAPLVTALLGGEATPTASIALAQK